MTTLLVFAATLIVAVLVSGYATRSILSTAVLFLLAGFAFGEDSFGFLSIRADDKIVETLAELALFSVLFTDGMRIGVRDLASAWRLPGRTLLFGMPLALASTAALAHWVVGFSWPVAFLIGAVLSPTDPVFAAAIVGREEVPKRLRRLLNVESGVNDGLALPFVIVLLAVAQKEEAEPRKLAIEIASGIAIGVLVPWLTIRLEKSRFFTASPAYEPLNAFAIGVLVLALSWYFHANQFLAAFAAGVTVATTGPEVRDAFHEFGELITELLKLAALLVFGALISLGFLGKTPWNEYFFALLVLVAVRPFALAIALAGSRLGWRERAVAAWFGPKGFASVVYGLLILKSGLPEGERVFHAVALAVAASIIVHSSTDVLIARWFEATEEGGADAESESRPSKAESGSGTGGEEGRAEKGS